MFNGFPSSVRLPSLLITGVAGMCLATALSAQAPRLGQLEFPNSGASEAQEAFLDGVLFMHNFEYEDAAGAFREAQSLDPDFALAYWGEALSYNHAIWMEQDREAAQATLRRLGETMEARSAKAGTSREAAWLRSVETLYGNTPEAQGRTKEERDDLYRAEMRRLHEADPTDDEAASFYALAILGTAHEGRDFATYMRAAAVVEPVFDRNPNHPGAAHYLIHSYDDPIHAPLGLPMARAYSKIAPSAGHAQHMTSHIFVAMGMWDDVVSANERARDVQNARQGRLGRDPIVCGHYTYWLEYGYLQAGRVEDAQGVLDTCYDRVQANPTRSELRHFSLMRARFVLDGEAWDATERYRLPAGVTPDWEYRFTDALASVRRGNPAADHKVMAAFAAGPGRTDGEVTSAFVLSGLLDAALRLESGDASGAAEIARAAAQAEETMPYEFGPPAVVKPAWELVGELYLAMDDPRSAVDAFSTQLDRTPGRTLSLLGLARAAKAAGDMVVAQEAYDALASIWSGADGSVPWLAEVRDGSH